MPGPGAQIAGDQIMRVETADDVAAAMEIDDRRNRNGAIRPIKAQADVARRTRDHPLLDTIDRQRFRLARLCGRLHLCARRGRGHRLDRLEVQLGHHLQDLLDLGVKVRHGALLSTLSPRSSLSRDHLRPNPVGSRTRPDPEPDRIKVRGA
jgi:hypothetical protein